MLLNVSPPAGAGLKIASPRFGLRQVQSSRTIQSKLVFLKFELESRDSSPPMALRVFQYGFSFLNCRNEVQLGINRIVVIRAFH